MKMMTQGAWQAEVTGFGFKGGQLSITVRDPFLGEQEVYNASACSLGGLPHFKYGEGNRVEFF